MRKILITGGAGFIGIHTADLFLNKGDKVTILDNFSRKGTRENVSWLREKHNDREIEVIEADVREKDELIRAVSGQEIIVHLAAQVAVTTSVKNPEEDFEINAKGTMNLLEAVRTNVPEATVIYASTNKVYGEMEDLLVEKTEMGYRYRDCLQGINEQRNLDFHSPYGCSKGAAEQYVHDYYKIYGVKTVVFRQSCIYGTRQFGIEDQGWISWFTIASILGKPITIYGDGYQVRDVLNVTDLVRAYELASEKINEVKGKVFNIGGGTSNSLSIRGLLKILEEKLGYKIETVMADWRPGDQKVYVSNIAKVTRELDWKPETEVAMGVDQLIKWTKDNQKLIEKILG